MELKSTLIGLVAVAICVFPFLYIRLKGIRKEKELIAALQAMARSNNSVLGTYDVTRKLSLGLSADGNYLFVFNNSAPDGRVIPLQDLKKCNVSRTSKSFKTDAGAESVITKLDLILTFPKKDPVKVELFDRERDIQLDGEVQLGEKWAEVISRR